VAQVAHRIEATADDAGSAAPDAAVGWGMVNPRAAVQSVLFDETSPTGRRAPAAATPAGGVGGPERGTLIVGAAVVASLAGVLILLRPRRMVRRVGSVEREVQ
jgi:hypothetical protein